jgi:hypothetical protein
MARTMDPTTAPPRCRGPPRRAVPLVRFSIGGRQEVGDGVTGVVLMLFVLGHMIGNLKLFFSKES